MLKIILNFFKLLTHGELVRDAPGNMMRLSPIELTSHVKNIETEEWLATMRASRSLQLYAKYKTKMTRTRWWRDNRTENVLRRFQCGAILTKSKVGKSEIERLCETCGVEEDIDHLVLHCQKFSRLRALYGVEQSTLLPQILQLDYKMSTIYIAQIQPMYLVHLYNQRFQQE